MYRKNAAIIKERTIAIAMDFVLKICMRAMQMSNDMRVEIIL